MSLWQAFGPQIQRASSSKSTSKISQQDDPGYWPATGTLARKWWSAAALQVTHSVPASVRDSEDKMLEVV